MLVVSWLGVNLGCDNRLRLTISNLIRPFSISFHSPRAVRLTSFTGGLRPEEEECSDDMNGGRKERHGWRLFPTGFAAPCSPASRSRYAV